jgi:LysM repeat protein
MSPRSPARWLAPIALVACALAVYAVVSTGSLSDDGAGRERTTNATTATTSTVARRPSAKRRRYTVRAGDTLTGIAAKTGVPLSEIKRLNPKLDEQTLQTGQRIKIRP